jgi:hypothetical protein
MVIEVKDGENMCTDSQLDGLDVAFSFATQQVSGICTAEVNPPRVCDVEKALADCISQDKVWTEARFTECRSVLMSKHCFKCYFI